MNNIKEEFIMMKVIGGLVAGVAIGFGATIIVLGRAIADGVNRGSVIHENDDIIVKQYKFSSGTLGPLAWVFDKKSEK